MIGGRVAEGALLAAGAAWTAQSYGWEVTFNYYPKAKGIGMNILRNGERRFGLDWHHFKSTRTGEMVMKIHKHIGESISQMKKHRDIFTGKPL